MTNEKLGYAERAVYELVDKGAIDASHAALYRRPLAALARAGLVSRLEDGSYCAVRAALDKRPSMLPTRKSEPPAPKPEPMQTLVVRVPEAWLEALDAIGPNRSEAARALLGRALAARSGSRARTA